MIPASLIVARFKAFAMHSMVVARPTGSVSGVKASPHKSFAYSEIQSVKIKRIPVLVDQTQGGGLTPERYSVVFVKDSQQAFGAEDRFLLNARLGADSRPIGGFECKLVKPGEYTVKPGASFFSLEVQRVA